jgi:hypothetical protein
MFDHDFNGKNSIYKPQDVLTLTVFSAGNY